MVRSVLCLLALVATASLSLAEDAQVNAGEGHRLVPRLETETHTTTPWTTVPTTVTVITTTTVTTGTVGATNTVIARPYLADPKEKKGGKKGKKGSKWDSSEEDSWN